MSRLTDSQIDNLYRQGLDKRLETLLPTAVTERQMVDRLTQALARRQARRRETVLVLLAAMLLLALGAAALAVGGQFIELPVITATASPSASASAPATESALPPQSALPTTSVSPTQSVLPTQSTSPVTLTVSPWRQIDPNPLAGIGITRSPVWSGSQFVIAGNPGKHLVFLTSSDGQTWSQSVLSKGYPLAYAFDGTAGVAVGSDGNEAAVWTSPDSKSWTRLRNPSALTLSGQATQLSVNDVAHGPAGYVALADLGSNDGDQPLVLRSPDGRDWHRLSMELFQSGNERAELGDVVFVDGRYVISGEVLVPGSATAPGSRDPTLWTSTDGADWTKEPTLQNGPSSFLSLVSGPAGALLTGIQQVPGADHRCMAWRSSDGLAWAPTGDCPWLLGRPGLVAAPFGFVASTPEPGTYASGFDAGTPEPTARVFPCAGGVEVSATGETWACVPPPSSVGLVALGDVAAASPAELLAIGYERTPSNEIRETVWLADVEVRP